MAKTEGHKRSKEATAAVQPESGQEERQLGVVSRRQNL